MFQRHATDIQKSWLNSVIVHIGSSERTERDAQNRGCKHFTRTKGSFWGYSGCLSSFVSLVFLGCLGLVSPLSVTLILLHQHLKLEYPNIRLPHPVNCFSNEKSSANRRIFEQSNIISFTIKVIVAH